MLLVQSLTLEAVEQGFEKLHSLLVTVLIVWHCEVLLPGALLFPTEEINSELSTQAQARN